jgi:nicotinate-nucleotide pyrophosphorylase (carboxylating)
VKVVPFEPLDPGMYRELVRRALAEDFGWGDVTTEAIIDREQKARGVILAKTACVMAGIDIAAEAFRQLDPAAQITIHCHDGERCERGTEVLEVRGHSTALLTAERTALNFVQRLCGIATLTRQFVDLADGRITILDTRKTMPTLRVLDKYAVRAGGATNHRIGLYDAVLIKENHIHLAGGVTAALERVRQAAPAGMTIEIEAETLEEVDEALAAGATFILLDNMSNADITAAVRRTRGRARVEISGGVPLERIPELAATGADFVSVGALTHSVPAVDISFEIEPIASEHRT